jgi:hypothetical protein
MYGDELHRIIENNSDLRNRIIAKIALKLLFPNFGKQDLQENPTFVLPILLTAECCKQPHL